MPLLLTVTHAKPHNIAISSLCKVELYKSMTYCGIKEAM